MPGPSPTPPATPVVRVGSVVTGAALSLLLVGCLDMSDRNTITPGFEDLPRCDVQGEVPIDQLDQPMLHDCNAEGVTIRLPEGWDVVQVPGVGDTWGATSSAMPGEFGMVNWGIEGVGMSFRDNGERTIWGTTEAARERQSAVTPAR